MYRCFASQLIASVALSGANVNFVAGAGYGYLWMPIVDFVLPDPGLALELDFFVRF